MQANIVIVLGVNGLLELENWISLIQEQMIQTISVPFNCVLQSGLHGVFRQGRCHRFNHAISTNSTHSFTLTRILTCHHSLRTHIDTLTHAMLSLSGLLFHYVCMDLRDSPLHLCLPVFITLSSLPVIEHR